MRKGISEALVLANAVLDSVCPRNAAGERNDRDLRAAMQASLEASAACHGAYTARDWLVASAYRLAVSPRGATPTLVRAFEECAAAYRLATN